MCLSHCTIPLEVECFQLQGSPKKTGANSSDLIYQNRGVTKCSYSKVIIAVLYVSFFLVRKDLIRVFFYKKSRQIHYCLI